MGKPRRTEPRERWKATRARWRKRWQLAAGAAAEGAARCLRLGPGLAGPVLVSYGLWLAWAPLGFIALGGFLLWADRRMP